MRGIIALTVFCSTASLAQESGRSLTPASGRFELRKEGGLSGTETGAARFEPDENQKVDGQPVFVVGLLTGAVDGGIFLVFGGERRPRTGEYTLSPVDIKGAASYHDVDLRMGEVALLYFEHERSSMILLGSTGNGSLQVLESDEDHIQGQIDVEVKGAAGNPTSLLGVRPRRGTLSGAFDATPGEVEFHKP